MKIKLTTEEKKYFKSIKNIEKTFIEFSNMTPLGFPKPKNLKEEKKKFFRAIADDKIYNPQIKYHKSKHDVSNIIKIREKIEKIDVSNDMYGFKELYKKKLLSRFLQVGYHEFWGSKLSSNFAIKYWSKPDYLLVLKAKKFAKKYIRETVKFERLTPIKTGNILKKEVLDLTGNQINIKYVSMASKANIEPANNLIQINKEESFTSLDAERLKVHEIGVHYMRYFNASKFGIKLLETGTEGYLETEEGLAAYNEFDKGVLSNALMFVYAGRVLACHYCFKKSFYEVFMILKKYGFTDKVAFAITFRVKRNLCDTSLKGGFTKDYVYFKGFYKVQKFAKRNDINRLFIGKISIKDLKCLKKFIDRFYGEIKSPFLKKKNE